SDESIARDGETLRQSEWRDELFKTGVRGKAGQRIEFSRIETLPTCTWLHADGETKEGNPQRVVNAGGKVYRESGVIVYQLMRKKRPPSCTHFDLSRS